MTLSFLVCTFIEQIVDVPFLPLQKAQILSIVVQLLLKLEETGLETEGILRVPGSASRVKVCILPIKTLLTSDALQTRRNL